MKSNDIVHAVVNRLDENVAYDAGVRQLLPRMFILR
jgi:hypothetical protein